MQILHPFAGSIQQYAEEIADPNRHRPDHCPQCQSRHRLIAHGFYRRTLVDARFAGDLRVLARLLDGRTLQASGVAAAQPAMPYQRGQFWIRRFQRQAASLCAALVALLAPGRPLAPAANFVSRALILLQTIGWIAAHRFLFRDLRAHLLGWPAFLVPDGRRVALHPVAPPA